MQDVTAQPIKLHKIVVDDHHTKFRCLKQKPLLKPIDCSFYLMDHDVVDRLFTLRPELLTELHTFRARFQCLDFSTHDEDGSEAAVLHIQLLHDAWTSSSLACFVYGKSTVGEHQALWHDPRCASQRV
ncbi:hypothetical protein ACH5RR_001255 [Cinchona calisaya]|uniref:Uncharacterized protein n=1 Tax=Cinchona calisaya TaxID=153742 RepID=A0ABD3B439_9GENT